ncbi:granzyme A-like [Dendrobates tinctorius]|uniref:granzyme A-like n=1 Tax=Dendrobates tinctorius TaxID=92724 RepID=UPI003CCA61A8
MRMEHLLTLLVLSLLHLNGHVSMDIIGGNEAAPHSRPYMALLNPKKPCGGALIKPNWILTAAHCFVDSNSYAILGAHRLRDTQEQQNLAIKRGIKYPCYDKGLQIYDLQLVELDEPAKLNKFVALLPLPKMEETITAGKICSMAGWGQTDLRKRTLSDVLREVNLAIVKNEECKKQYSKVKQPITDNMMCARAPNKHRKADTCARQQSRGGTLKVSCDQKVLEVVVLDTLNIREERVFCNSNSPDLSNFCPILDLQ